MSNTDKLRPYVADLPDSGGYRDIDGDWVSHRYTVAAVRAILADAHVHYEAQAQARVLCGLAQPDAGAGGAAQMESGAHALPGVGLVVMEDGREVYSVSGQSISVWQALASWARAQYMTTEQQQAAQRLEVSLLGGAQPAGDAAMPATWRTTGRGHCQVCRHYALSGEGCAKRGCPDEPTATASAQADAQAALAAQQAAHAADLAQRDQRIAVLENFSVTAKVRVAELTARVRHAEDCLDAAKARIADLEKALRADTDKLMATTDLMQQVAVAAPDDAPAPVPYETIASDVEALVEQHMMLVDKYATLHQASLDSGYALRQCAQARMDVADSVRRIRGLR